MKNITSAQARTHTHTHKLAHTSVESPLVCLENSGVLGDWIPSENTLFLSQCGQCATSAWSQLAEEEEEEGGSLGQMILALFHCKHSPEA